MHVQDSVKSRVKEVQPTGTDDNMSGQCASHLRHLYVTFELNQLSSCCCNTKT